MADQSTKLQVRPSVSVDARPATQSSAHSGVIALDRAMAADDSIGRHAKPTTARVTGVAVGR